MNSTEPKLPAFNSKGITLIEILLVLGLLVILLSFAMPSVSGAAVKAEMSAAFENVQYSVQMARKAARTTESDVSMIITTAVSGGSQAITFTSNGKGGSANNLQIQDFSIPDGIVLVSDHDSFVFDEKGVVQNPGNLLLVAKKDEAITKTIAVE